MNLPVYLDNNATTPVDPRILEAMLPYFTQKFGNAASRSHSYGWIAEEAVKIAREQVAELIGASVEEIIFTSGATESDNLAIKGVFETYQSKGNHIITVTTEHKAVLDTCKHLEKLGARVTYLPVQNDGLVDLQQLKDALTAETILVSVMYANNEIGVIQPIREMAALAHERGALFMTDAAQGVGKVPIDVNADGIDLLSLSAHKIYGPKGVGALYVRRRGPRVKLIAQMDGGGHERAMRSGTLNVPGIVGLGRACELARFEIKNESLRVAELRDKLEHSLLTEIEGTFVNGNVEHRLPGTTNITFRNAESEGLMMAMRDIAVSSGSACTSASLEPSHVLRAIGLPDDLALSAIRFGLGRFTTAEEIDYTIEIIKKAVSNLRELKFA
jgi:cysteine desulfurase